MTADEAIAAFSDLAFPYETRRFKEVEDMGLKMAHYTTAENALLILQNETLWLRNAQLMNDFSEVAYGTECLSRALLMGLGAKLETALDGAHPGLWTEISSFINGMEPETRTHTYLTSLSAHAPHDVLGRLSMWRAYGGPTSGVALILNTDAFGEDRLMLRAYTSPVVYGDEYKMVEKIAEIVEGLTANPEVIKRVPFDSAKEIMINTLQFATLSHKHQAFAEEQEWRVIHRPTTEPSEFIKTEVVTLRGIPQMVCKLPLKDEPDLDMPWLNLDKLIYRIIIGPCVYPQQVKWAFSEVLRRKGIDPTEKIVTAEIPLRQQG